MDFSVPKEAMQYLTYLKSNKTQAIPKPAPQLVKALEGRESIRKSIQFVTQKIIKQVYNF